MKPRTSTILIVLPAAGMLAILTGCDGLPPPPVREPPKSDAAPAPETPASGSVETQIVEAPPPSPLEQVFAPPRPGEYMEIQTTGGTSYWGYYREQDDVNVRIVASNRFMTIPVQDIATATLERIDKRTFVEAVSKRIDTPSPEGEAGHANPPAPEKLLELRREDSGPWAMRIMRADLEALRWGPGLAFGNMPERRLYKGDRVYEIRTEGEWILIAASPEAARGMGWISRYAVIRPDETDLAVILNEVARLMRSGYVESISVSSREAKVHPDAWLADVPVAREGKTRMLSLYCTLKSGGRAANLRIRRADNGERLADYSRSRGFREVVP